jgi:hypothetical protein
MFLRLFILLALTLPLAATQEGIRVTDSQDHILSKNHDNIPILDNKEFCKSCDEGRGSPSGSQLLQAMHKTLKEGIFVFPQIQPLVAEQIIVPNLSNPHVVQTMGHVISANGIGGPAGAPGAAGTNGAPGIAGPAGPAGGISNFADFYALMPPDNSSTVGIGVAVEFPETASSTPGITRLSNSQFQLGNIGAYLVMFQVSIDEAGQLVLGLDTSTGATEVAYTVVGRATGTSQIMGIAVVFTTTIDEVLTVRNPLGEPAALTITPKAGGKDPVSAHLLIMQIQ